jgi:hypothetical protein
VVADDGAGHAATLIQQFFYAGSFQNSGAGSAGNGK